MEESFELLSSMSPRVKGRQKTLKMKKASTLALKKYFRRSAIFEKSLPVNNADLAVLDLETDTSESTASSKVFIQKNDKNGIIVIDSSDSDDEEKYLKKRKPKRLTNGNNYAKNYVIQQWLCNVEEDKKTETFFSQVSTIFGDDAPNADNRGSTGIAACSSFNEYPAHRFDELFIDKKRDVKKEKVRTSDALSNKSCSSPDAPVTKGAKNQIIITESLLTSDESILQTSPRGSPKRAPKTTPFVSLRKNQVISKSLLTSDESSLGSPKNVFSTPKSTSEQRQNSHSPKTPSCQSMQDIQSMLDSFYGKKWRKNELGVLQPMSEPKKKEICDSKIIVPNTDRVVKKPKIKENLFSNIKPAVKKLNFERLKTPVQSPWAQRLEGLVDSDSDSNSGTNDVNSELRKSRGINMVKTKLNFDPDGPTEISTKSKKNNVQVRKTGSNKENNPNNANRNLPKKSGNTNNRNIKKSQVFEGSNSSNSCVKEDVSTDEDYDKEIQLLEIKRKSMVPVKTKAYNFLESLSGCVPISKCDPSARIFRTSYKEFKEALTNKLFALFNEKVFDNALPKDTELEWNVNLRKTAGLCHCKKITHKSGKVDREVKISLSTKVLDSADRLRDTLIHEMCHAVTWIVNQVSDGHGPYWKSWAFKAMKTFPELPLIKRCHAYTINSKYTYKCTGCGYSFGRHTKSLDTERKRCGHCYGKFEVLLNKFTKNGETKTVSVTTRKEATGFALFVKDNYALYKEPTKKHGDVMKILGQKFSELKVKNGS